MRISRNQMWMEMAEVAAKRSTCYRGNTGAIIIRDNNIVSVGYNGPESGEPHCQGNECKRTSDGGCARSIHAEHNAIDRARVGDTPKGVKKLLLYCNLYSISAPCEDCAKLIDEACIMRLYYRHPYRLTTGLEYLIGVGTIPIFRVLPSGILINERTGQITEDHS